MKITVEISNYPLSEEYIPKIKDFIMRCNQHEEVVVKTNATSTHLLGEYDVVMNLLNQEIKASFEQFGKAIFVIKIINGALDI